MRKLRFYFIYPIFIVTGLLVIAACSGRSTLEVSEEDLKVEIEEDYGKMPWVIDIEKATMQNDNYLMAVWTGDYMQMVLMSLKPGEEIDLELHRGHDQFIRIEEGHATVYMGENQEDLDFEKEVADDWVVMIPAGYWHKVVNTGMTDLKLYTLYAPAEHKTGTIHETHDEAKALDHEH